MEHDLRPGILFEQFFLGKTPQLLHIRANETAEHRQGDHRALLSTQVFTAQTQDIYVLTGCFYSHLIKAHLNLADFVQKSMNEIRGLYQIHKKTFHAAQIPGLLKNSTTKLGQDGEFGILVDMAEVFPQPFHPARIIGIRPGIIFQILNGGILQRRVCHFIVITAAGPGCFRPFDPPLIYPFIRVLRLRGLLVGGTHAKPNDVQTEFFGHQRVYRHISPTAYLQILFQLYAQIALEVIVRINSDGHADRYAIRLLMLQSSDHALTGSHCLTLFCHHSPPKEYLVQAQQ